MKCDVANVIAFNACKCIAFITISTTWSLKSLLLIDRAGAELKWCKETPWKQLQQGKTSSCCGLKRLMDLNAPLACSYKTFPSLTRGAQHLKGCVQDLRCCPWSSNLWNLLLLIFDHTFLLRVYTSFPCKVQSYLILFLGPEYREKAVFGELLGTTREKHQSVLCRGLHPQFTQLAGRCWTPPPSYISSASLVTANCFDNIKHWPRVFAVQLSRTGSGEAIPRESFFLTRYSILCVFKSITWPLTVNIIIFSFFGVWLQITIIVLKSWHLREEQLALLNT